MLIPTLNLNCVGRTIDSVYAEHQKDLTAIPRVVTPTEVEEEILAEVAMKCAMITPRRATIKQLQKVAFDRLGSDAIELREDFDYLNEERGLMGMSMS